MDKIAIKTRNYNLPYKETEKQKALNLLKNSTIDYVSRRYHCTIQTLYRWKHEFDGTLESLKNKSHRPKTPHPNSHTPEEIKHITDLIKRNPHISLNELYGKLRTFYAYTRNPGGLYHYLRKHGYYKERKPKVKRVNKPYDTPTEIGIKMQLDVKVVPRKCYCDNILSDEKYFQYTIIDEATRERFIYAYKEQSSYSTVDFIKRAILYFGYKPKTIQTDNGVEFTYTQQPKNHKIHSMDILCNKLGIEHKTIRPRTPQHNGKVERSHRNDNERFYSWLKFYSYEDLQQQMKDYLRRSNEIPTSVLKSNDGKEKWLTPKAKKKN